VSATRYALVVVDMSVGLRRHRRVHSGRRRVLSSLPSSSARDFPRAELAVLFTTVAYNSDDQARIFREKLPSLNVLQVGSGLEEIDERVAPIEGEPVIVKRWPSGFFRTDLDERLRAADVDGVVVTGLTTSGCVRATALDALQYEYRTVVPAEAVGDQGTHEANLHDFEVKYADILSLN